MKVFKLMTKLVAGVALMMVFLAGCSSSTNDTAQKGTGNQIEYTHDLGTVTYPDNPTVVSDWYQGELLYLDANLIGADLTYTSPLWIDIANERNVENVGQSLESIAALNPDIIITINEDLYDQYSAIAPTIYIEYGLLNPEEVMLELGKVIGKTETAQNWVDSFNKQIELLKEEVDQPDLEVSIVEPSEGDIYMMGENWGRGGYILYDKLNFKGTPQAEEDYIRKYESYVTVNDESLPNYVGDVIFAVEDPNSDQNNNSLRSSPIYEDLKPVQDENIYSVDATYWWYLDPYALDQQVKDLQEIYKNEL